VKLLLDTHVLLWVLGDPDRLRPETRSLLADADHSVFVSMVSLWEIAVKRRVGKLEADLTAIVAQLAPASKIQRLGVTTEHLHRLDNLPFLEQHRDPFDHLIIAQAICEGMTLVTQDQNARLYPLPIMLP
jgi:PIN domain nuclease of toxin-antitoxin system